MGGNETTRSPLELMTKRGLAQAAETEGGCGDSAALSVGTIRSTLMSDEKLVKERLCRRHCLIEI